MLLVELDDCVADFAQQGAIDAGTDLVQENDLGVDHHRTPQLEQFLLPAGQVAGDFVGEVTHVEKIDDFLRASINSGFFLGHLAAAKPGVDQVFAGLPGRHHHQVLDDRQACEFVCNLKRAQQALVEQLVRFQPGNVLIVEKYPAPGRGIETGDGVEQGGLAGPVGADQAGDGTLGNFERNMIDRLQAAKVPGDVVNADHR